MIDILKRKYVSKIKEDLLSLNATQFEYVGHILVSALEGKSLIHRGLSETGNPVGYTVDTFDSSRELVAEYSTENGYFEDPYEKIKKDVTHACSKAASLQKLYLLSNQEDCSNSKWEDVRNACKEILKNNDSDAEFEIYDLRRFAESIFDQVLIKTSLYEKLLEYIASLKPLFDDYQFSSHVPEIPNDYISDAEIERQLGNMVYDNSLVIVHGISGMGKSYLINNFTNDQKSEFENVYWIQGDDLISAESLANIHIKRLGVTCNLAAKFNSTKCLLVVDSYEQRVTDDLFGELRDGCEAGGRIVVSSQKRPDTNVASIPLSSTNADLASKILSFGLEENQIDKDAVEKIVNTSGGHPLLMSLIRGFVKCGDASWENISSNANSWAEIEDDKEKTILVRILHDYDRTIRSEISLLYWLDVKLLDQVFLRDVLGPVGLKKLCDRCLLQQCEYGVLKLHDLTHICLKSLELNIDEEEAANLFLRFFESRINNPDVHFQRSLHMAVEKVCELVKNDNTPDLKNYLYLLLDCFDKDAEKVSVLSSLRLMNYLDDEIAVHTILEANEKQGFANDKHETREKFNKGLLANIEEALGQSVSCKGRVEHVLWHHKGKTLKRLDRKDEALVSFDKALALESDAFHTKLQIARLVSKDDPDKAKDLLFGIIARYIDDNLSAPITVVLAALAEFIQKRDGYRLLKEKIEVIDSVIHQVIMKSTAEGFSQPFELIAKIGQNLWYNSPQVVVDLYSNSPLPDINAVNTRMRLFDIAESLKQVGKAYQKLGDVERSSKLFKISLAYYEKLNNPHGYKLTMMAEAYILSDEPEKALGIYKDVDKDSMSCYDYHRKAQSLEMLNKNEDALVCIKKALEKLDGDKFRSAFLDRKAHIMLALGNVDDAREVWRDAIKVCKNEKFRDELEMKIKQIS